MSVLDSASERQAVANNWEGDPDALPPDVAGAVREYAEFATALFANKQQAFNVGYQLGIAEGRELEHP